MGYVHANLDDLESFDRYIHSYLSTTATNYHSFYMAVQHLEWDDPILERVTEVMNDAIAKVNNIRRAIAGAEEALRKMEDILGGYVSLRKEK